MEFKLGKKKCFGKNDKKSLPKRGMGYKYDDASAKLGWWWGQEKVVGLIITLLRTEMNIPVGRSVVAHSAKKMFLKSPACLHLCMHLAVILGLFFKILKMAGRMA
jgi:hypothetical protein